MSFKVAWLSCEERVSPTVALSHIISEGCVATFAQGDTPYTGFVGSVTVGGQTLNSVDVNSVVADFRAHHQNMRDKPSWAKLAAAMPIYYMPDDHEWGGDNWDHTLTRANKQHPINATTQLQVDNHFNQGRIAAQEFMTDNPANTDPEAIAEKPSSADPATPVGNYGPLYCRIGYALAGNVVPSGPHAEFYIVDCISHRTQLSAADNASKTMFGANQKNWLKTRVAASTAVFKVIVISKKTYKNSSGIDNGDTFGEYTTERDEILDYFDTLGVTGIIFLAGDRHTPNVITLDRETNGRNHVCVTACPVGVDINGNAGGTVVDNQERWINRERQVFGLLTVTEKYLEVSIQDANTNASVWSGRVYEGTNRISYSKTAEPGVLNYLGNSVDATYSGHNQDKIAQRLNEAVINNTAINYIIVGDSTRANPNNYGIHTAQEHYKHQLNKLGGNITVDMSAEGAMDSVEWRTDVTAANLTQCLGLIPATGHRSIVEFSLGINDWTGLGLYSTIKNNLKLCLDALLSARPDLLIILAAPVKSGNPAQNIEMHQMYFDLSKEYRLPLFDTYKITQDVQGNIDYYSKGYNPVVVDVTHPNEFGHKRYINQLIKSIVPRHLNGLITTNDVTQGVGTTVYQEGMSWSTSTGADNQSAPPWTRMEKITVPDVATTLLISHSGNRNDVVIYDKSGDFVETIFYSTTPTDVREVFLPEYAGFVGLNINHNDPSYDPAADNPSVTFTYMSGEDIDRVF